jgi:hypothetical protein
MAWIDGARFLLFRCVRRDLWQKWIDEASGNGIGGWPTYSCIGGVRRLMTALTPSIPKGIL